jgi:hypothetical protein
LSKIESQLGSKSKVTQTMWNNFPKTLLTQFKNTYDDLFVANSNNPNGESDIQAVAAFKTKFPTLAPIISGVENWQKDDFDTSVGSGNTFDYDVQNWNGNTQFNGSDFGRDIVNMAQDHYSANHPTSNGGKSGATDYLQNWWTDGNADQQLVSGQSQQNTTQVQSYMQLLQGFDSSAQQDIQLASTQKSQIIQNEKTS